MAVFQTLYSGSSGNSSIIRDGNSTIMVDMGKSCKLTLNAMYDIGVSAKSLSGILITHEHSDHVSGLKTFLKHYDIPVYSDPKTLARLVKSELIPREATTVPVYITEPFDVGGVRVESFRTEHDSAACVGYRFAFSDGTSAAIATDLGHVTESVMKAIGGCSLVALESNYDDAKLMMGRYPIYLKNRIASPNGHLSNFDCAAALTEISRSDDADFVLMHLSQENNAPELALTTCYGIMENSGISANVSVAPRNEIGEEHAIRVTARC